ncbi:hypothetical protein GOP47_0027022, partial [Adiantum capillus-veneris]
YNSGQLHITISALAAFCSLYSFRTMIMERFRANYCMWGLAFLSLLQQSMVMNIVPACAADPDPIVDHCVADLSNTTVFFNGLPCKNPSTVSSADFHSSLFRGTGNTSNPLGLAATLASAASFPALNTQGLAIVKIEYASTGGLVEPHVHPRASELIVVVQGTVLAGFIDTSGNYFSATLQAGDLFIFPRGLIHFSMNLPDSGQALAYASFNSQNPGLSNVAPALFASTPGIPNTLLEKTFAIAEAQVLAIKKALVAR